MHVVRELEFVLAHALGAKGLAGEDLLPNPLPRSRPIELDGLGIARVAIVLALTRADLKFGFGVFEGRDHLSGSILLDLECFKDGVGHVGEPLEAAL